LANGSYDLVTEGTVKPVESEYVGYFIRDALPSILTALHSAVSNGKVSVHTHINSLTCYNGNNGHYISVGVAGYVMSTNITWNGNIFSTQSYYSKSYSFPTENFDFDYSEDPSGSYTPGGADFTPPTPTSPKNIGEVPFYEDLIKNSEIGDFNGLDQAEYDHLKGEVQKKEVGLFDTLINMAKDFFVGSSGKNSIDGFNIAYDSENSTIVDYYNNNGLDISKSYNINMDGIRVGYDVGSGFTPVTNNSSVSSGGFNFISDSSKDNFFSKWESFFFIKSCSWNSCSFGSSCCK